MLSYAIFLEFGLEVKQNIVMSKKVPNLGKHCGPWTLSLKESGIVTGWWR